MLQIGEGMHLIRCLKNTLRMFIKVIMYECIFTFLHVGALFSFLSHFPTCNLIHILNQRQRTGLKCQLMVQKNSVYKIRPKGEGILQILALGQDDMSEMHLTIIKGLLFVPSKY